MQHKDKRNSIKRLRMAHEIKIDLYVTPTATRTPYPHKKYKKKYGQREQIWFVSQVKRRREKRIKEEE